MNYLMSDLNLDKPAAMLMYRAERLQEKGQLQQALRYFDRVLATNPDCDEAVVNARMLREELSQQAPSLPPISEHVPITPVQQPPPSLQTVDFSVTFTRRDCEQYDSYWAESALNDAALTEARTLMQKHGVSTPFLMLVQNDIEIGTPDVHDDPWMDNTYTCRATVRATFPPPATQNTAATPVATAAAPLAGLFGGESAGLVEGQSAELFQGYSQRLPASSNSTNAPQFDACSEDPHDGSNAEKETLPKVQSDSATAATKETQGDFMCAGPPVHRDPSPSLHLLEYTRTPVCFDRALIECQELADCIASLRTQGFAVQRESGLKVFVPPELYNLAVAALELHGEERLRSRHILASDEFVEIVRAVLAKLPSKQQVKQKAVTSLECSLQADQEETMPVAEVSKNGDDDAEEDGPVEIKHTFLHIRIPSSLYSDSSAKANTAPASLHA